MRVIPEIFWEEEMPQSRRLNFITIKFRANKACAKTQGSRKMRVIPEIFWEEGA